MLQQPVRRRTSGAAWFVALLSLALLASLVTPAAAAHGTQRKGFTLTVLHNNDGESDLLASDADTDPGAGTISRFGHQVKELREQALRAGRRTGTKAGVVTISAGDNFLASPEWQASLDKGVPYYDAIALDSLDYDAFTIGNHEFDFGPDVLANFIRSFSGRDNVFLSANLDFSGEPALQKLAAADRIRPSVVVKERGERIGIIGVTTPELREVSSPGDVEINDDLTGVIQAEVNRLTRKGINKILVSSHLQDIDNELALVPTLSGVDAVIGGGGGEDIRDNYPLTPTDADGRTVPVVTVPGDYFDVGRLELQFNKAGEVVSYGGGLEAVTSAEPQDRFILRKVEQPVADYVAGLASQVVATSEVGLNGIRADVRSRETNTGNLLTDAMLATGGQLAGEFGVPVPQVALQNGGGIRNDSVIGPGDITQLNTFDIAPFTNFVAVIPDVARADLLAAAEHGLSGLPGQQGFFGQWGGLVVEYDGAAAAGSRVVNLTLNDGTAIVTDGQLVDGDPVTVATIDFLAAGNDGYDMFEPYDFTVVGVSYQQSLSNYLTSLGTITAADYADPVDPADRTRIIPIQ
jgi:5'-nucleotidase